MPRAARDLRLRSYGDCASIALLTHAVPVVGDAEIRKLCRAAAKRLARALGLEDVPDAAWTFLAASRPGDPRAGEKSMFAGIADRAMRSREKHNKRQTMFN